MNKDIKLTRLLLAFFQRTNFIDISKVINYIEENIVEFKDCKKEQQLISPVPFEQFPRMQLTSEKLNFSITIYNDRIDLQSNGIFDVARYDQEINSFLSTGKKLLKLVSSKENICGRIGIVNDSFIVYQKPTIIIADSFIIPDAQKGLTQLYISYTKSIKIGRFDSNLIDTIQPGELNSSPVKTGVMLRRDVNIKEIQLSISVKDLDNYIEHAKSKISKSSMMEILRDDVQ